MRLRKAGLILTIVGFLLMGYAVYEVASGKIYQAWRGRKSDRTLNSLPSRPGPHPHPSYEQGSAIGRLEIPRIGLSVVVLEGSDTNTLRLGVGRVKNSAFPSEAGNVVLAGHRDTFFRSLREIRKGDRISLRTPEGTFPYTVDWTSVVNPTDTSVIMPTRAPALTLVTCYPFHDVGAAPQRFIVRALPAEAGQCCRPAAGTGSAPSESLRRAAVTSGAASLGQTDGGGCGPARRDSGPGENMRPRPDTASPRSLRRPSQSPRTFSSPICSNGTIRAGLRNVQGRRQGSRQKIRELIHEGNVRRIIIKDEHGHTFMEIPLTVATIGVVAAPILAAVGAIATVASPSATWWWSGRVASS